MFGQVQSAMTQLGLTLVSRLIPRRHDDWRSAMVAEFHALPPSHRARWLSGMILAACKLRVSEPRIVYAVSAVAAMASLVAVDWSTANDATALTALVLSAALLGFQWPHSLKLSALLIGGVLLAAHAAANFTGEALPFYQCKPLTGVEFLVLATLILPAIAGAKAGAALRPLLTADD